MILHISTSIEGLLRNYKNKNMNNLIIKDGQYLNGKDARKHLKEALQKGWKLLPSNGCDNFDHQKGCLGHEDEVIKETLK